MRMRMCSQLHLEMIRQAEEIDERERQWTTDATKLRGQIADLTFMTTQQAAKATAQVGIRVGTMVCNMCTLFIIYFTK